MKKTFGSLLIFLFLLLQNGTSVIAQEDYRSLYITISDAIMSTNVLLEYDKMINPVDSEAERLTFKTAMIPVLQSLEEAILLNDKERMKLHHNVLQSTWTQNESIVREQSIDYYRQIETIMARLSIELSKDTKDYSMIQHYYEDLALAMEDFAASKKTTKFEHGNYTPQTLINLLDHAIKDLDKDPRFAVEPLEQLMIFWPAVKGDILTKSGTLSTELENNIPLLAGKLASTNPDVQAIEAALKQYKQEIELLQEKDYTVWDAALILIREGIEALLIVSALIAFLRKTNNNRYQKWIWYGAVAGIVTSIIAVIAGTNREIIEGYTGVVAILMMLSVGTWLHQKTQIDNWNTYISSQVNHALSTGSVLSLVFISFLSIFRKGAATIILYMGMTPSISTGKLLAGLSIAIMILLVFTVIFIKYSIRIPLVPFIKIATLFIYILAFKILGISLHALQLSNVISTSLIKNIPFIDLIGLYPTWETVLPQLLLVIVVIISTGSRAK